MNEIKDLYMNTIIEKINAYNYKINNLDIERGKIGMCFSLFQLSQLQDEHKYQKMAEKILDDILFELCNKSVMRTAYELTQIGIGINYLIKQKYVRGSINSILNDIDSLIFKKLVFNKEPISYRIFIPTLYYFCNRVEEQKTENDMRFMLEEICIKLFNDLYCSFDPDFFDEPLFYNIMEYKLPQFLYTASKLFSLQFYNYRVIEVLKEISGLILSGIPTLHSNRLYLLWSLSQLKKATGLDIWDEQINILINYTNYQKIIYKELRNRDMFIRNGVAGIYLLLNALENTEYSLPFDNTLFRKRIEESDIWNDEQSFENLGLINGFSGLLWVYTLITNER